MRIRSIKPEFWRSLDTARYDYFTRLLFIGLWSYVDDNGVGNDSVDLIRADLFPLDAGDGELSRRIHGGLTELSNGGQIVRYEGPDKRRYLYVRKWDDHQRINRPTASKKPLPTSTDTEVHDTLTEPSMSPHDTITEGSLPEQGSKGTREQGTEGSSEPRKRGARGTRLSPDWKPSAELVEQMRAERPGLDFEAEHRKFVDHFLAAPGQKGVKVDWSAAWRNWMRRAHEFTPKQSGRRENSLDAWSTPAGQTPAMDFIDGEVVEFRRALP